MQFPGGMVRIDENQVWRELARWMGDALSGEREVMMSQGHCLLICHTLGREVEGKSRLGLADAVAQALQTFNMPAEDGDSERDVSGHAE